MKKPIKSNMYMDAKLEDLAPYDHAIDGDVNAECLVLSYGEASQPVRDALTSASDRLGFGEPAFGDLSLLGAAKDAFALVEGVDPVVVVCADELSGVMFGQAYRIQVPQNNAGRALGRPFAAFVSFEEDLARSDMKQRDWAVMKSLAK